MRPNANPVLHVVSVPTHLWQALLLMNEPEFLKAQSFVARDVMVKKAFR